MNILGFQKMTLLDFPNRVACTVFTAGCNFRCPFCHNAALVTDIDQSYAYKEEDIFNYLQKRKGILDGVAITGGEPLLQKDIKEFIKKVKDMGYKVKLDTNGSFPDIMIDLIESGLIDYVAVDIKNSKEKYLKTIGLKAFDLKPVERTIEYLLQNKVEYEFRTTIVKELHEENDIKELSLWIKGAKKYFLQNFTDSGNLIGENMHAHSVEVLENMRKIAEKSVETVQIRGI